MRKYIVKAIVGSTSELNLTENLSEFYVYGLDINDACERASIRIMSRLDVIKPKYEAGLYSGFLSESCSNTTFSICLCLNNKYKK